MNEGRIGNDLPEASLSREGCGGTPATQRLHYQQETIAMTRANAILTYGAAVMLAALIPMTASAQRAGVPNDASESAAARAAVKGRCGALNVDFAASDLMFSTTSSTTYVNIPDTQITFVQSKPGCVIVHYSAFVYAASAGAALMYVRPLLDNAVTAVPAETQFAGDDDEDNDGRWARSHAMNFVFPNVPAGAHRLTMQWRSNVAGQTISTHRRTTLVHHR
jgi:hypothetical protein